MIKKLTKPKSRGGGNVWINTDHIMLMEVRQADGINEAVTIITFALAGPVVASRDGYEILPCDMAVIEPPDDIIA